MKGTKRLAAAITTLFAAGALALSASAAAAHNYKGDINRDDKVNITDLVCLNKHFQNISYIPEENIVYADMDGNGRLNVIDFMFLKIAALFDDEPEEIEITAPTETTPAVTTKTTTAATTVSASATTAATTKAATTTTTKSAVTTVTTTTKAAATTTTTTTKAAATTTTKAAVTTTTTTTSTTKASSATTTTTTTTTATTAASEASTSKTYPAKIGNGVNDLADASKDRAWLVLGGSAEECDYVKNASDFVPGSVKMPEITGDGTYTASFYVYDEALVPHGGSITFAHLKLLKAGTWETYSLSEKPDLKLTVTGATIDGQKVSDEKISALTQSSDSAAVQIDSILGPVNNVEIQFKVEGYDGTGSSSTPSSSGGTSTNNIASTSDYRAFISVGAANSWNYVDNIDEFVPGSVEMPKITGNGTYTAKFEFKESKPIYYATLDFLIPNVSGEYKIVAPYNTGSKLTSDEANNVRITATGCKVDGADFGSSVLPITQNGEMAWIQLTSDGRLNFTGGVKTLEITFTITGLPDSFN